MAERLNLLDRWKILETIMRDLSLARNDLIVSQDLLDHYHDKVGGSRSSSRVIATRTGLARSRVQDCLGRLIDHGHFATIAGQQRGSKAVVYAPRKREGGPAHGASSAGHGPVGGSTKSPGGPAHGATTGPVGGATNASSGPVGGSNKTLREEVCLTSVKSKLLPLGPTGDASRNPSLASGAPGSALPGEPKPAKTMASRLEAAMAAKVAFDLYTGGLSGGSRFSASDLRDAHTSVFCGEGICLDDEELAEYAACDLGWTRLIAAIRVGDPGAGSWINAAAAAEREYAASELSRPGRERDDMIAYSDALRRLGDITKALIEMGKAPTA